MSSYPEAGDVAELNGMESKTMEEKDAIQEDVSEEIQDEVQEQKPPRSASEAVARRILESKKDVVEEVVEEEEPEEQPKPVEKFVTIKVDGVEQQVPESKALEMGIRALQKETAADQRLAQANQKLREIEELKRRVHEESKLKKTSIPDLEALKKEYSRALVEDEDKAAEIFSTIVARQIQLEEQLKRVSGSLETNEQFINKSKTAESKKRINYFKKNHPTLASNPVFTGYVNAYTKQLQTDQAFREENPDADDFDVIDAAAKIVKAQIKQAIEQDPDYVPPVPLNPKETMPRAVKRAGGKVPAKPEYKPKTPSEIISETRRLRGLS